MYRSCVVLAAMTAAAGFAMFAPAAGADPIHAPGATPAAAEAVVCRVVNDSVSPGGMRHLVVAFPADDMRRIMKSATYDENFGPALDRRIAELRSAWKQKYGQSFSIARLDAAISGGFLTTRKASGNAADLLVIVAGGQPQMNLSITRDKGTWSAQVPRSLTANALRKNLMAELSAFDQPLSRWPAHEADAYRQLSRHALAAVMGLPPQAAGTASSTSTAQATLPLTHPWWEFWK